MCTWFPYLRKFLPIFKYFYPSGFTEKPYIVLGEFYAIHYQHQEVHHNTFYQAESSTVSMLYFCLGL